MQKKEGIYISQSSDTPLDTTKLNECFQTLRKKYQDHLVELRLHYRGEDKDGKKGYLVMPLGNDSNTKKHTVHKPSYLGAI